MSKLIILILALLLSNTAKAEEGCNDKFLDTYLGYQDDLKNGRDTAVYWDIKGMVALMKSVGVSSEEYNVRIASYIYNYNDWQMNIEKLVSVWAKCTDTNMIGIIEIIPPVQDMTGRYLSINMTATGKITDISFENSVESLGIVRQQLKSIPKGKQNISRVPAVSKPPISIL